MTWLRSSLADPVVTAIATHLLTVLGFVLIALAIVRLLSERRQPGNTFAWLLSIAFVPYLGIPLYLLLGGRKLRQLAAKKAVVQAPGKEAKERIPPAPPVSRVLDNHGASPMQGGNRVTFIESGEQAFALLEQGIREARHTIHVMTFILGKDDTGRRVVELLAERARAGIKVRLLLDGLGSFYSSGRFCAPLRQAGGEVVRFMPMLPVQTRGSANLRNHRKMFVIDHRVAAIGGRNLAMEYMGPELRSDRWRDFGAVIEGPTAGQFNELFLADWAFASGQSLSELKRDLPVLPAVGHSDLQVVASGPDVVGDPLYEGILALVQHAMRSIWIVTPYFIPDEVLLRSLIVRARAGLDVRVVVPAKSNHPITDLARNSYLRELRSAGASILYYQPGMSHAKALLVDGQLGLIGSANMDMRSLFVNFEVGLVMYSEAEALRLRKWMEQVFAQSAPMPAASAARRMWPSLAEDVSRLLTPLL